MSDAPRDTYVRQAVVVRHHDGDTLYVDWDLGDRHWRHGEPMRLLDVFAPELRQPRGAECAAALAALVPPGTAISVQTYRLPSGAYQKSFERYIARIWRVSDGLDVNAAMREVIGTPAGSGSASG